MDIAAALCLVDDDNSAVPVVVAAVDLERLDDNGAASEESFELSDP